MTLKDVIPVYVNPLWKKLLKYGTTDSTIRSVLTKKPTQRRIRSATRTTTSNLLPKASKVADTQLAKQKEKIGSEIPEMLSNVTGLDAKNASDISDIIFKVNKNDVYVTYSSHVEAFADVTKADLPSAFAPEGLPGFAKWLRDNGATEVKN